MPAQQCLLLLTVAAFFLASALADFNVPTVAFDEAYTPLFGDGNLVQSPDGRAVQLTLNRYSGAGFVSSSYYHHGFFSASIKLPRGHMAGVVVAFYLSNGDVFERNHDELDFEFLGNRRGHEWKVQTNVYGGGSTDRGREERYLMPFDPTAEPHRYSILWSPTTVIFYIDDAPIREVVRTAAMGLDYPSKPMAVYATIWDGSTWATDNGKYKVSYKRGPFTAEFSDFVIQGCRADTPSATSSIIQRPHRCAVSDFQLMTADYALMTTRQRAAMRMYREKNMLYTVCYDAARYAATLPECEEDPVEKETFSNWGESKVVRPKVRRRRRNRVPAATIGIEGQAMV